MAQEGFRPGDAAIAAAGELPSIIAPALRITGNVVSGGVVHVEGEVDGDVQCLELTVGPGGRVIGTATAGLVYILGDFVGTIRAREVRIGRGATVRGEVIHEILVMEHGSRLDGYSRPVKQVDSPALADLRRFVGRGPLGEPLSPERRLTPGGRGREQAVSQSPPPPSTNPLH